MSYLNMGAAVAFVAAAFVYAPAAVAQVGGSAAEMPKNAEQALPPQKQTGMTTGTAMPQTSGPSSELGERGATIKTDPAAPQERMSH